MPLTAQSLAIILVLLLFSRRHLCLFFFFFNDTATTEIYTLSLHDALPICAARRAAAHDGPEPGADRRRGPLSPRLLLLPPDGDRKSTRLNSSHSQISYAVFCLKKKKKSAYAHS